MTRAAPVTIRHEAREGVPHRPLVVSLHRPEAVSGINAWGARMARLGAPHARWHVLVVGEELTEDRARRAAGAAPAWSLATWRRGAGTVEQVRAVRGALRELGAEVVAPNDVAHGFVCAGLDHHRGLRSLAVCHACSGVDEDFFARVGALADCWIPVSERARARLGPLLARSGRPLPPVVPCGVMVGDEAQPPSIAAGPLRLLYVGRLDQHCKRVLDLPVLCGHLDRLNIEWTLTVAGDGSARAELARALDPFIRAGRASMLGLVPGAETPDLYARADCLVLLSAFEGWPVTVIEAMAASRPVAITTGCGGALDVVRDGVEGFVVPTGEMGALAERIAGADRRTLARMGAAAHDAARSRLNLKGQAAVYDEVVAMTRAVPDGADGPVGLAAMWGRVLSAMSAIDADAPRAELLSLLLEWLEEREEAGIGADLTGGVGELLARVEPTSLGRVARVYGAPGERWMGWPVGGEGGGAIIVAGHESPWGAVRPVLPLAVPRWPGFASRCFLGVVSRLRAAGASRIALYGAGRHTRRLGEALAVTPEVVGIVDDRAGAGAPDRLWGLPVVGPGGFAHLRAQAVVVSSDEHQAAMAARAKQWAGPVPVILMYGPDGHGA